MNTIRTYVNFTLPFDGEQVDRIMALVACIEKVDKAGYDQIEKEDLARQGFDEEAIRIAFRTIHGDSHWGFVVEKNPEGKVCVYGDEDPDIDALISFTQEALNDLNSSEVVGFEWTESPRNYCQQEVKSRSTFNHGGAVAITKARYEYIKTDQWLFAAMAEMKAA